MRVKKESPSKYINIISNVNVIVENIEKKIFYFVFFLLLNKMCFCAPSSFIFLSRTEYRTREKVYYHILRYFYSIFAACGIPKEEMLIFHCNKCKWLRTLYEKEKNIKVLKKNNWYCGWSFWFIQDFSYVERKVKW